jgi:hypothetical protein
MPKQETFVHVFGLLFLSLSPISGRPLCKLLKHTGYACVLIFIYTTVHKKNLPFRMWIGTNVDVRINSVHKINCEKFKRLEILTI